MKRIITLIVALFLIVPCGLSFVGCFGTKDQPKEFDNATSINLTQFHEIRLDEAYTFNFSNFTYQEKNVIDGEVEEIKLTLIVEESKVYAEGFYNHTETDSDDAQNAKFYIIEDKLYVNRAETAPVKNTGDSKHYGKFYVNYNILESSSIYSLTGFARKLATKINTIYSTRTSSQNAMNKYVVDNENISRLKETSGTVLRLKLTSADSYEAEYRTNNTETKLYFGNKVISKIVYNEKDVIAEVNMPVVTNTYSYTIQSFSGTVNSNIPTTEYSNAS